MKIEYLIYLLLTIFIVFYGATEAKAATYTVTATAGSGGSISPSGAVLVNEGDDISFTITPDNGYVVANISIDGTSQGAASSYTLYRVKANSAVTATFLPKANIIAETIYVDNALASDCLAGEYSVARRDNSGIDGNAYNTIIEAANAAGPGDTVLIRGGTYHACTSVNENDVLWPKNSGTSQNPIVFKPYNGEEVILGDGIESYPNDNWASIARAVISLRNVSYIEIEGLKIRHVAGWLWARNCHHITIKNCWFEDSLWDSKGVARFIECVNCRIVGNTFRNSSYDALLFIMSDYNLVENNTFEIATHSLLSLRSASFNVIRNNHFSNSYYKDQLAEKLTEVFDQKVDTIDPINPSYIPIPGYNGTRNNVFENNLFGYHPDRPFGGSRTSAIQFSGQSTIIRKNIFSNPPLKTPDPDYPDGVAGGVAIVMRWGGSWDGWDATQQRIVGEGHEAGYVTHNRIYNNVFYGYDNGKIALPADNSVSNLPNPPPMKNVENYIDYPFTDKYAFEDNIFKNNVFSEGRIVPHINWGYLTMNAGKPVQMFLMGRVNVTYFNNNNFFATGEYSNNLIYDHVDYPYQDPKTPAFFNANQSTTFSGNIQQNPLFVDVNNNNFHLRQDSRVIDVGDFLTIITGPSGSGNQITVADAGYFYDGYGIDGEQGDLIKLESGQTARILDIDYSAGDNRIIIDRQISWHIGEKVSVDYDGTAPDIGAYEYVLSAITGLSVSGTSQNSLTFGWTVPGEEGVTGTPTRYDVRYSGSPLTEANWDAATQVQGETVPGDFGDQQSFTISGLNPGATYYFAIKTVDEVGHTSHLSNVASGTTATSGNHAPVLALIGDRSVVETQELTFVVSATDADGDALAYSATNLPMGAGFTPATRIFTWIPTNTQSGTYRVTFQVTDGQVAVSETVKITVRETPNQAPVLEAVGDKIVNENASLSFSIKAADPDGDALTYSAMGLPSGATFTNQVFSWIPSYDQAGSYSVTFSVSDGELTDDEKITITVVNVTDMTAPSAHDFYPLPDSIQAPLNCLISFTISDGGWGVDGNTVTLHVNEQLVYSGDRTIYESTYGVCRRTGTRASYRYYYHPINIFNFDQQVSVRVNASDIAHNAMIPVSYQFKTEMRSFGQNKKVASGSDILAKGSPSTVADNAGNIWVTWESGTAGSRDIYVGKLTSGADNFDSSIRLTESSFDQCNPAIAVGSDDKLYVVWQDNRRGNWDIYASVSADGIAWSTGTLVVDSNNNEVNPAIAVDKSSPNRAYVVWQDDRNGNQDIYIAASSNSFLTAAVSQITSNSSDQIEPAIAVGPSNAVYVIWTDNRGGSSDIYGAVSNYGSWTNVPIVNNASNQTKPAIAVESAEAKLHILWVDGRSGNQDIYYATSDGLPGSPLSGSSIIDDTSAAKQSEPVIITNGSSKVFACWQDERNVAANGGDTDLYMAELTSDSRTNILVGDDGTNSNQSEPAIGVGEYGHPYLVWAYGRSANTEIYYAASTFVEPVALKTKDVLASLGATVGTDPASITSVNDVSVVVPAGACLCDMKIAISKMKNPQAFTFAKQCLGGYDFGPSGMQFSQPVTVTIPYTPSGSGTSVSAYWYNSLTGAISQQGISGVQDIVISPTLHALQFKTTHFTPFYLLLAGGRGGGGGGGCEMSVGGEGDIVEFLLPYVGLAVVMLVLKLRDRRNRKVHGIT